MPQAKSRLTDLLPPQYRPEAEPSVMDSASTQAIRGVMKLLSGDEGADIVGMAAPMQAGALPLTKLWKKAAQQLKSQLKVITKSGRKPFWQPSTYMRNATAQNSGNQLNLDDQLYEDLVRSGSDDARMTELIDRGFINNPKAVRSASLYPDTMRALGDDAINAKALADSALPKHFPDEFPDAWIERSVKPADERSLQEMFDVIATIKQQSLNSPEGKAGLLPDSPLYFTNKAASSFDHADKAIHIGNPQSGVRETDLPDYIDSAIHELKHKRDDALGLSFAPTADARHNYIAYRNQPHEARAWGAAQAADFSHASEGANQLYFDQHEMLEPLATLKQQADWGYVRDKDKFARHSTYGFRPPPWATHSIPEAETRYWNALSQGTLPGMGPSEALMRVLKK